ncbi:MAG: glycine zipper family protein [Deltaproteobacteria bacterium]|nr:glycine zipper family protein [Deltaproteobacteria bacterium]
MNGIRRFLIILVVIAASGCATMPSGPSVMVMPPPGKPFETFQMEDSACREWAERQVGMQANETVNQNLASGAAIGTLLGTGLGAAIGSASGHVGAGAAIGAAGGLALGAAGASEPARASGYEVQRRYDIAYQQCMYSKGNQVPGVVRASRRVYYLPPPPPGYAPLSPYSTYPPPPPY